nr:unnamed protein product [Digitaria exilis]
MDAEGLLASAAINLGLALVTLSLFSLLKKQPGNAPVYRPRRMAAGDPGAGLLPLGHGRLTPSFRWIGAAFRLSEEDVLRRHGLEALVVIRLFKFGYVIGGGWIKCFTVCSIVGVLVLAPTNYTSEGRADIRRSNSMELFTVTNVARGSNRLWVHFSCLCFISFYVVYLLHNEYKEITGRRIEHLKYLRKRPDQYTILVRGIPTCPDHGTYGCYVDHFFSKHYQTYQSYQEVPVAFVSFKSRLDAAQAAEMQLHVNPLSLVTTYAPEPTDIIWKDLAIPFWRMAMYKLGVFLAAFLLTVFFTIPVTAVQGIVQFEKIKRWFPPARAVQLIPGLNSVVTGYLPSMILNGFIYLVPFAMLGMASFEGCIANSQKEIKACNMVFYFLLGNVFFLSVLSGSLLDQLGESFTHPKDIPSRLASAVSAQMEDVYDITYDTCGQYWPNIHHYIFLSVTLMQITMIGLFGLKSKPGASFATIPLLVLNILFNEYCKVRFLPTFHHRPVQVAKLSDELDEAEGTTAILDGAIGAYKPPWMHPTNLESTSVQPLNV